MAQSNSFLRSPFDDIAAQSQQGDDGLLPGQQPVKATPQVEMQQAPARDATPQEATPAAAEQPAPSARHRVEHWLPPADQMPIFEAAAQHFDVPVNALMALSKQESSYRPDAIGVPTKWGRAKGIMQYLDSTAQGLGINPFDPAEAIPAAAKQLRERLDAGASLKDAVMEHFAGPDRKLWGPKTAAYGDEVMAKVDRIGQLYAGGSAPSDPVRAGQSAADKPDLAALQQQLDTEEPGRYKVLPEGYAEQHFSAASMPRDTYEQTFRSVNPGASDAAIANAMQQYDQQAQARAAQPAPDPVADRFKALQQTPEATFDAKLNQKLQGQPNGIVPPLPVKMQPEQPAAPATPDGVMGDIGDVGRNLKIGANMAAQDLRELLGRVPVVGQSIVRAGDAVDEYFSGKPSDKLLADDTKLMVDKMTPAMKAAQAKKWWDSDKGTFGDAWSDPRSYASGVIQSLPEQAMTMAPAMALAKYAYGAKLAAGAAETVASAAAARTAMVAGALSEGALGGAQSAREVRQQVADLPQSVLDQSDAYKSLLAGGMSEPEARKALSENLATRAFVTSGIVTGMFGGMGDRAIAKLFTEQVGKASIKQALGAFGKGALAEGLFEELPQSAGQQLAQNEAMKQANPNQKLSDDVLNQALGGAIQGGLQGGGMGAVAHGRGHVEAPAQAVPAAEAAPAPAIPASGAPAVPVAQASAAPGPLSRSLENAAEQHAGQEHRVTATAPGGEQVSGQITGYHEDADGNFVAQIVADDGTVVTLDSRTGVQIEADATPDAGPLTASLANAAEQHAAAPPVATEATAAPGEQAAAPVEAAPAAEAPVAPAPKATLTIPEMTDQQLQDRLKYIASQAKDSGWDKRFVEARRAVESEIKKRASAAPAAEVQNGNDLQSGNDGGRGDRRAGGEPAAVGRGPVPDGSVLNGRSDVGGTAATGGQRDAAPAADAGAAANTQSALSNPYHAYAAASAERAQAYMVKRGADPAKFEVKQTGPVRWQVVPKEAVKPVVDKLAAADAKYARQEAEIAKANENAAKRKAAREAQPQTELDAAAHAAATSPLNDLAAPTEAQQEAGNYTKGHITLHGMDISIENPRGSTRSGKREDGSTWSHDMSDHYGYIKRTTGADGEQVDVYVGPKPESQRVYVIDQINQPDSSFDEHKAMLGYTSRDKAVAAYKSNFDKGWKVGPVKGMSVDEFKAWLKEGDTTKPFAAEAAQNTQPEAMPAAQAEGRQAEKPGAGNAKTAAGKVAPPEKMIQTVAGPMTVDAYADLPVNERPARTGGVGGSNAAEAKARAEQDAQEAAAKKETNRGKTIEQRRADSILDKPTKFPPSAGLGAGSRRDSMRMAVEQERAIVEKQVSDDAARKSDKEAIDRMTRAGYMIDHSNPNIPAVKSAREARDRLKADKYTKPEYRVYSGRDTNGSFFVITKTEYDYAQSVKAVEKVPEVAPKQPKPKQEPRRKNDAPDTPAFKKFFSGSKVVDEDGKPLAMYHGTSNGGFDTFDTYGSNYGLMGMGGYFTADPEVASSYTTKGKGAAPTVYKTYLNIKNPIDMDAKADVEAWKKQFDGIEQYHEGGDTNEAWYRAAEEMMTDEGLPKWEGAEAMQEGLRAMGHDGITHIGGGRVAKDGVKHRVYVAFDPEQIKSATGNSGEFDAEKADIRYSIQGGVTQAEFGPVHTEYRDDPAGAVKQLMADKDGEAIVHRDDVGDISLVYGDGKMGLSHIARRRGAEFMDRLPGLLADGTLYSKPGQKDRVFIGTDRDETVLRFEWDGKAKTWLLSAYEKYPDLKPAGDVQESRRSQVVDERTSAPIGKDALRQAVTRGVLGKVVDSMIDAGVVVLHDNPKTLPRNAGQNVKGVQAVTMPDGKIHLVASNLTAVNANAVMLHEAFHQGADKLLGTEQWGALMGRMGSLYRQGEQSSGKAGEFWEKARARVAAAKAKGGVSTKMEVEEFAAYAIEEYESAPATVKKWVDDLLGMIKAWLVKRFGKQIGDVTPAQLSAFAKWAVMDHAVERRGDIFGDIGNLFSVAGSITDTPAFKRWFGDSKVVDKNGQPLVVYHGSPDLRFMNDDGVFKSQKEKIGFGRAEAAHWFAASPATARSYADPRRAFDYQRAEEGVIPAYLRMENPLIVDGKGQKWRDAQKSGKTTDIIQEARDGGHDGVIIRNVKDNYQTGVVRGESATDTYVVFSSTQIKSADRNSGDFDPANPDIRYSLTDDTRTTTAPAAPQEPNRYTPAEQGLARRTQAAIQDNLNRVTQVQDKIKEVTGRTALGRADYRAAEVNRPGRIAARLEDAQDKLTGPLMEELARSGYTPAQLSELLHAQHAEERNEAVARINPDMPDGGSGMTNDEAQAIIENYKDAAPLQALAAKARAIAKATLDLKLAYGLIKPMDHDMLSTMYENYVPLKGDGEYGPKVKRAMGHDERDEHILENIARDYDQAVVTGEKNLARQSLLQMVLKFPDAELWTAGIPPRGRYVAGKVYSVQDSNGKEVGRFTSQPQVTAFLEGKGPTASRYAVYDSAGERVTEFTKPLQDNEVMVYVNGDPVRLQIHDEKLAAQLRPLGQDQMGPILSSFRKMNRYLSSIYTGYNPAFILRNASRDAITGTINMLGNEGAAVAAKAWTKYPAAVAALGYWAQTKKAPDSKTGRYLTEYRMHGGKTGASYMSDLEQQGEKLQFMYDKTRGLAATAADGGLTKDGIKRTSAVAWNKTIGRLAHVIEVANQATENGLRLGLYIALREEGVSADRAAQAAKGVTVDFDRKGASTGALGAIYLFFNPAVQGTANAMKTLFHGQHKAQAWAALGGLAAAGFLAASKGMDDDKDKWLGEGWDTRTKNLIVNTPGHQLRAPMSQEFAPAYAFGVAMAEASRGESKNRTAARIISSFIDAYFPLQGAYREESDNHLADAAQAATPTVIKPLVESAMNRNSFGSQVVPESELTKDKPDNLKMNRGTKNTAYDKAAQGIASAGELFGAGKYENDITKVSPETLKSLWRTYTGGLGQFITDSAGVASMASKDMSQVEASDVPIIKDFYRPANVNPIRSRYYDLSKEAKAAITEFEQAKKLGDGDELSKIADGEKGQLIGLGRMVRSTSKAAAALGDEKVEIAANKDLTDAEKRAELKRIEKEEEELYRSGIEAFK